MAIAELDEFVNKVRERSDIYAVVSRYIALNFKGGRYWACCPFHNEKTASFTISPDKGMFYCFGCHQGGNVFKFISLMENISYFDAIKLQAERLGIALPSRKKTPAELKLEQERKSLLNIMTLTQEFYHNSLVKTVAGEKCRKYLAARGITSGVIDKFKLGYAPDSWDALTKTLRSRGFDDKQLLATGVAHDKQSGAGVYDRMRDRMIIPIADINGNVVGFGGRILNEGEPKYLNTPETAIFIKGKLLFGLDKATRAINAENCAVVVEGYMDAISLASAGIENVVATLGTAFSAEHAKLLMRYTRRIILCYDSDEAGQRATMRALPIIQNAGAEVFVVAVPDGKDPDEFVRKHGKAAFENLLKNALPFVDYKIQYILARADVLSTSGRSKALRSLLPILSEINDAVLQIDYCRKIAAALVLNESAVLDEWRKFSKSNSSGKTIKKPTVRDDDIIQRSGSAIIKKAWHDGDVLSYVLATLPKEIFIEVHREILNYFEKCREMEKHPSDISAAEELSAEANAELSRILTGEVNDSDELISMAYENSIKALRRIVLKAQYEKARRETEEYLKSGDEAAMRVAFQKSLEIQKELNKLMIK